MENLIIKGTNRTPDVDFNANGNIRIWGRSIPEDAGLFYNHLYSWIFRYCMNPQSQTDVHLDLEYMNSGSSKAILHILKELSSLAEKKWTFWFTGIMRLETKTCSREVSILNQY